MDKPGETRAQLHPTAATKPDNLVGGGLAKDHAEAVSRMLGCSGSHVLPGGAFAPCSSSDELNTLVRRGVAGIRKPPAMRLVTRRYVSAQPSVGAAGMKDVYSGMPSGTPSNFAPVSRDGSTPKPKRKRVIRRVLMGY